MNRERRSKSVGNAFDTFLVEYRRADLDQFKKALNKLEAHLLRTNPNGLERLEIQRRCAEVFCSRCLETGAPWHIVMRAITSLENLGYSNVERRSHFAVLLKNYAALFPEAIPEARKRAKDALRKIGYLRCSSRDPI